MPRYHSFGCKKCGHAIETSGPTAFYRDCKGERKYHGGWPCPSSKEAYLAGVAGFSAEYYCPTCDKVYDTTIVEYKEPYRDYNKAWDSLEQDIAAWCEKGENRCAKCGSSLVLDAHKLPCPKCETGQLRYRVYVCMHGARLQSQSGCRYLEDDGWDGPMPPLIAGELTGDITTMT